MLPPHVGGICTHWSALMSSEHLGIDINRIPERIARCPQDLEYTHLRFFYMLLLEFKFLVKLDC